MTLDQLSAAATWLRQCHDWMMTNDLDMQCPMETSPEDIAISLEAIIEDMTSPDDKVEVLYAYCCAEGGGDPASCDCVNKDHGLALFPKATCIITNCRNRAPAHEAFCAKHKD